MEGRKTIRMNRNAPKSNPRNVWKKSNKSEELDGR
jgi:hypothetical protein